MVPDGSRGANAKKRKAAQCAAFVATVVAIAKLEAWVGIEPAYADLQSAA